jgi:hypothetical protein
LLEGALDPDASALLPLGRAGAWRTAAVKAATTVAILRLRYKLTVHGRRERLLLAEEAGALAWGPASTKALLEGAEARELLEAPADSDLELRARQRVLSQALTRMSDLDESIAAHARQRAEALAADHARVRAAASGSARVSVEPVLPPDIIGLYVLTPAGV